jgi:hypothetical protein
MNKICIELEHKQLESSWLSVNETDVRTDVRTDCDHNWCFDLLDNDQLVCVYFRPWKINPILRVNGFMVNKWLANVEVQDHCLKFIINKNFFQDYQNKDLQGRLNSLGPNPRDVSVDRIVGRQEHRDIIRSLKEKIIEKSNIS